MRYRKKGRERQSSLKANMFLNALRTSITLLSPLITAPYIARILSVEDIGKYNFCSAFLSYFTIVSSQSLGLYAIREGAPLRGQREKSAKFTDEIYSISANITIVEYFILYGILFIVPKFSEYRNIAVIMSFSIVFTTIGADWVYSIYEDYTFITLRTIAVRIVSIALTFVLIRNEEDLYKYALLYFITAAITGMLNRANVSKYSKLKYISKPNTKLHLPHILYITASTAAIVIYTSFDTIMLGLMTNDFYVGLYGVSSKIYVMLKSFLSAFIVVSIPRFSFYEGNGMEKEYNHLLSKLLNSVITLIVPVTLGCALLSKEIIMLLFGPKYAGAYISLSILSVAAMSAMLAYIFTQCVLMPLKKEGTLTGITIISAVTNIVLNILVIPLFKHNGAALTTVIAEWVTLTAAVICTKGKIKLSGIRKTVSKVLAGCFAEFLLCMCIKMSFESNIVVIFLCVLCSVTVYILLEWLLKNESIVFIFRIIKHKILKLN